MPRSVPLPVGGFVFGQRSDLVRDTMGTRPAAAWRRSPGGPVMAMAEGLVLVAPVLGIVALFIYLARSRTRVMRYHDIPTHESTK
jgi:hypothetical protein